MSRYFREANSQAILGDYPIGARFEAEIARIDRTRLRALQDKRFRALIQRAWDNPFYRRRWSEAGLEAGDIDGLDDLGKIPAFSKSDLMASVETHPPFGEFVGPGETAALTEVNQRQKPIRLIDRRSR